MYKWKYYLFIYLQIIVQHQQSDDFDNEPCSLDFFMSIFRSRQDNHYLQTFIKHFNPG